jgi:hypothetical protein
VREHEFEPVRGLPERLPPGEHMLWQGAPCWQVLARRAFHARKVAAYFAVLVAWAVASGLQDGLTAGELALTAVRSVVLGALAVAVLAGLAWLSARSTVYTITNRRVVLRIGMALSLTLNLPFRVIESAALRVNPDGTGDIPLTLTPAGGRIGWLHLWPHARPWQLRRPQPMLRAIPDAERVADLLADALADHPLVESALSAAGRAEAREPARPAAA